MERDKRLPEGFGKIIEGEIHLGRSVIYKCRGVVDCDSLIVKAVGDETEVIAFPALFPEIRLRHVANIVLGDLGDREWTKEIIGEDEIYIADQEANWIEAEDSNRECDELGYNEGDWGVWLVISE